MGTPRTPAPGAKVGLSKPNERLHVFSQSEVSSLILLRSNHNGNFLLNLFGTENLGIKCALKRIRHHGDEIKINLEPHTEFKALLKPNPDTRRQCNYSVLPRAVLQHTEGKATSG